MGRFRQGGIRGSFSLTHAATPAGIYIAGVCGVPSHGFSIFRQEIGFLETVIDEIPGEVFVEISFPSHIKIGVDNGSLKGFRPVAVIVMRRLQRCRLHAYLHGTEAPAHMPIGGYRHACGHSERF